MINRIHLILFRRTFYDSRTKYDTIFAPSTLIHPSKGSPLAVIRISGPKTQDIIKRLTLYATRQGNSDEKSARFLEPRKATLTRFYAFHGSKRELIDIGLTLWFPKPASYTGEDVGEFHLHGSHAIVTSLMSALANFEDVRPAEPGEFTRRAVSNKKMSLIQAESLTDLISSQTENQRRLALRGLDGSSKAKYEFWIETLVKILAHLEASIDFGEDELIGEREVVEKCRKLIESLSKDLLGYIEINQKSRQLSRDGIRVAILGKPNAGKSTFMNLICQRDKSIVSDLAGTTRDIIEHTFELAGHKVTLCDTAGLRDLEELQAEQSSDHRAIEIKGIKRALEESKKANLILYIIDGKNLLGYNQQSLSLVINEIKTIIDLIEGGNKRFHLVVNKIDLDERLTDVDLIGPKIRGALSRTDVVASYISCKTKKNLDRLIRSIGETLDELANPSNQPEVTTSEELEYVNERHLSLLTAAHRHLDRAGRLRLGTIDQMAQHVREAVDYLSRIIGTVSNDDVLDVVFRDFCIGK